MHTVNNANAQRKGTAGESEVNRILSGFNSNQYRIISNVLLKKTYVSPEKIPTVQIDHVIVSIYGIFSIIKKESACFLF